MGNKRHQDNFIKIDDLVGEVQETHIYHDRIYFGNLEKYLPKKAVYIESQVQFLFGEWLIISGQLKFPINH